MNTWGSSTTSPGLLAQVVPSHASDFHLWGSSPSINTYPAKKYPKITSQFTTMPMVLFLRWFLMSLNFLSNQIIIKWWKSAIVPLPYKLCWTGMAKMAKVLFKHFMGFFFFFGIDYTLWVLFYFFVIYYCLEISFKYVSSVLL